MSSALVCDRDTVLGAVAGLEAAVDALAGVSFDGLTNSEAVGVLARLEALLRREPVIEHRVLTKLKRDGSAKELGAKTSKMCCALRCGSARKRRNGVSRMPMNSGSAPR